MGTKKVTNKKESLFIHLFTNFTYGFQQRMIGTLPIYAVGDMDVPVAVENHCNGQMEVVVAVVADDMADGPLCMSGLHMFDEGFLFYFILFVFGSSELFMS